MRTFRYHPVFAPLGRIFDTTGREAPLPPSAKEGWVEHLGELTMTAEEYADAALKRAVQEALAAQGSDRDKLDSEHRKKFGDDPHTMATSGEVANVMDNKTADGAGKIRPPKKSKTFTRPWERG